MPSARTRPPTRRPAPIEVSPEPRVPQDGWTPQTLRVRLGFEVPTWARLLGVNARTVERWEDEQAVPSGLTAEVFRGLAAAVDAGVKPAAIHKKLSLGLAAFLCGCLEKA